MKKSETAVPEGGERSAGAPSDLQPDALSALRRSHAAGEVSAQAIGREVVVMGWAHSFRDHGGLIFIDLRDRSGLLQLVFRPDAQPEAHARAEGVRREYVLAARGTVRRRAPEEVNPKLPTGEVEVEVEELRILNTAEPPPFAIEDDPGVDEQVRQAHRVHDLRRSVLQSALELRHHVYRSFREGLCERGFLEIETPILAKATPEGARDFLVPSRRHAGEFYALPQSPQLMKQLLMVAGFERYFQIARCFRDEDQRADRQLEFTQVDLEMSFVGVEDVLEVLEALTLRVFSEAAGIELPHPFPRLSYDEAMSRYGSDRPDTRIGLELVETSDIFKDSGLRAFRSQVEAGGIVKCLPVHEAEGLSRGEVDRLERFVKSELGGLGLAWVRVGEAGAWQGPIAKFMGEAERHAVNTRCDAKPGTLLFFQADTFERANAVLARLRIDLGERLGRIDPRPHAPLFVVDFPLFVREEGELACAHMPFVAPREEDIVLLDRDPFAVRATHYDVVVNGVELGSGSLRNHRADVQRRIFEHLGYSEAQVEARFGFLLRALSAGAPPHGGFAFGLDRMVMLMAGAESLRDVIAFPKTQRGQDLLMDAPAPIDRVDLEALGLRLRS